MKTNRWALILGLIIISCFYCSKKDSVTNPGKNVAGANIVINANDDDPAGLDSLLLAPADSWVLQAATLAPANPPSYKWSVGNASVFQLTPDAGDSSKMTVTALGDSGAVTTITVKDTANNQQKTISLKVAVWANMQKFSYVGSLNKHHYFLSVMVGDWASAKVVCEDNHGHLAAITSTEENDIVKQARTTANEDVWIGIRYQFDLSNPDRTKDLKWTRWITGEPVVYKNWASGQPDFNAYPVADWEMRFFGYMNSLGKWADSRQLTKRYVLEIP
jgi:hypothetical protein